MNKIKNITVKDVVEICHASLICGNEDIILENYCRDTRKIKKGEVFIGIKGEKVNGSEFYEEALENGASVCLLQDIEIPQNVICKYNDRAILIVENTIKALQELAAYKRNMYDIPVVAITGSVGKTSTKDIVASVMAEKYNVLKTEGNYNSQLGLALTILRLKDHNAMVVEMGMSDLGEIHRLSEIAKPSVAIITNVGTAHIEYLKTRENILKAKMEILDGLQSEGRVIINNDNDLLHNWYMKSKNEYSISTYGMENQSDIMPENVVMTERGSSYDVKIAGKTYSVKVPVGGNHFVLNSLCAITVGTAFNIPMEDILDGIANFELTKRRMQIEEFSNEITVINDCYNANYDSMKAAIQYLGMLKGKKNIAVLGDMLELGDYSEQLHRKVGEEVAVNNVDVLITGGKEAKYIAEEAKNKGMQEQNVYIYDTNQEVEEKIREIIKEGNVNILLKASNGMKFQEIYEHLFQK